MCAPVFRMLLHNAMHCSCVFRSNRRGPVLWSTLCLQAPAPCRQQTLPPLAEPLCYPLLPVGPYRRCLSRPGACHHARQAPQKELWKALRNTTVMTRKDTITHQPMNTGSSMMLVCCHDLSLSSSVKLASACGVRSLTNRLRYLRATDLAISHDSCEARPAFVPPSSLFMTSL